MLVELVPRTLLNHTFDDRLLVVEQSLKRSCRLLVSQPVEVKHRCRLLAFSNTQRRSSYHESPKAFGRGEAPFQIASAPEHLSLSSSWNPCYVLICHKN